MKRSNPLGAGEKRVGYALDVYPMVSLTFIDLEIQKLTELGLKVDIFVIWKKSPVVISDESRKNCESAVFLSRSAILDVFRAHLYYLFTQPVKYIEIAKLLFGGHSHGRNRLRTLLNFLIAPHLANIVRRRRICHLHAHFAFGAATTALMVSKLIGISYSFTAHGSDLFVEKTLLKEKVESARFVVTISQYNKRYLLGMVPGVPAEKIHAIHTGVDTDRFQKKASYHCSPDCLLLAVGNLVWQKGHRYLIEACGRLKQRAINFRCVIVGDGPLRSELEKMVNLHHLADRIAFAGSRPHEQIIEYYRTAHIFVHPSVSEGIPVVLMEAMSTGLPVIATHISGIPELVTSGHSGILVSPKNVEELASAIVRVKDDVNLMQRLGQNARDTVVKDFSIDRNVREIFKLIQGSLAS